MSGGSAGRETDVGSAGAERSADENAGRETNAGSATGAGHGSEPAGTAEDALLAAKRELKEETGHTSDDWQALAVIPSNATIADNYAHIFVARNCKKVSGQDLDETEFLNVTKYTQDEIEEMIKSGEFPQMAHVTAYLLSLRA
ncbi:MAG: NUDIX hydrolase [Lachnospiraceae bacterium]|nr:NUDIX hydrolase [Lachnospiraceae bacterium]